MDKNGKLFRLLLINVVDPSIPYVIVKWNYSTKYDGCQTAAFGNYLFSVFIKQGKQCVKNIKENIKTFTSPSMTLNDVIIFTSFAVCVKSYVFEHYNIEDPIGMAKELISLMDQHMVIRDVITDSPILIKKYIKEAVKELTDKYYDYINEIVDREFDNKDGK